MVGIRAYNVLDQLKFKQRYLFDYVENGVILWCNTILPEDGETNLKTLLPTLFTLSRDRVTDENSAVEILAKKHALINYPNKINKDDFNGGYKNADYTSQASGPRNSPLFYL